MAFPTSLNGTKLPTSGSQKAQGVEPVAIGGAEYFPSLESGRLSVEKATDPEGGTWAFQDSANRPTNANTLSAVGMAHRGSLIAFITGEVLSGMTNTVAYFFHIFDASTDTWTTTNQSIVGGLGIGASTFIDCAIAPRGTDEWVAQYRSADATIMGTAYQRVSAAERSSGGTWTTGRALDNAGEVTWVAKGVLGIVDRGHHLLQNSNTLGGFQRTQRSDDSLETFPASFDGAFRIGNGVAYDDGGTGKARVPYIRSSDSSLRVLEFDSADTPTVATVASGTTATPEPADRANAMAADGTDQHLVWIDDATLDLFRRINTGAGWGTETEFKDAVTATDVHANVYLRGGATVLAVVWWDSALAGYRYEEAELAAAGPPVSASAATPYESVAGVRRSATTSSGSGGPISAVASAPVETTAQTATSATSELEVLGSAALQSSAALESLQAASRDATTNVDSGGPVASGRQTPTETVAGVEASAAAPSEHIGAAARQATTGAESTAHVAVEASTAHESGGPVTFGATSPTEALGSLAAAATAQLETLAGADAATETPIESGAAPAATAVSPSESLAPVTAQASPAGEHVGTTAGSATAPAEALQSANVAAVTPIESGGVTATPVSNAAAAPIEWAAPVSASAQASLESTARAAAGVETPTESSAVVAADTESPAESTASVQASAVTPLEVAAGAVGSPATTPTESGAGLAASALSPAETLQAAAATSSATTESVASATAGASTPIEWDGVQAAPVSNAAASPFEWEAPAAATSTVPSEALAPAAGTAATPTESLQAVATTSTAAGEVAGSVAGGATSELEHLAEADRQTVVPIEWTGELIAVSAAAQSPVEQLGRAAAAAGTPDEYSQEGRAAADTQSENLAPVAAAVSSLLEALESVPPAAATAAIESLQGVRIVTLVPYEWESTFVPYPTPSAVNVWRTAGRRTDFTAAPRRTFTASGAGTST